MAGFETRQKICQNLYKENDLVYIRVTSDMSKGWALTKDSICLNDIIYYDNIDKITTSNSSADCKYVPGGYQDTINIFCKDGKKYSFKSTRDLLDVHSIPELTSYLNLVTSLI